MSLRGSSASNTVASGISGGSGIWTMIPETSGSSFSSTKSDQEQRRRDASLELDEPPVDPDRPARAQDLLQVDGRRRVLADDHHGQSGRISVARLEPSTSARTAARISFAIGAPSMSRADPASATCGASPSAFRREGVARLPASDRLAGDRGEVLDRVHGSMTRARVSPARLVRNRGRFAKTFAAAASPAAEASSTATRSLLAFGLLRRPASQPPPSGQGTPARTRAAPRSPAARPPPPLAPVRRPPRSSLSAAAAPPTAPRMPRRPRRRGPEPLQVIPDLERGLDRVAVHVELRAALAQPRDHPDERCRERACDCGRTPATGYRQPRGEQFRVRGQRQVSRGPAASTGLRLQVHAAIVWSARGAAAALACRPDTGRARYRRTRPRRLPRPRVRRRPSRGAPSPGRGGRGEG